MSVLELGETEERSALQEAAWLEWPRYSELPRPAMMDKGEGMEVGCAEQAAQTMTEEEVSGWMDAVFAFCGKPIYFVQAPLLCLNNSPW